MEPCQGCVSFFVCCVGCEKDKEQYHSGCMGERSVPITYFIGERLIDTAERGWDEWRGDATNLSVGELVGHVHCPSSLAISLCSVPFL